MRWVGNNDRASARLHSSSENLAHFSDKAIVV